MKKEVDIHKAGGIFLKDKKFLITRSKGKGFFVAPGGKLEKDENAQGALIRELKEEVGVEVSNNDLEEFGVFFAKAQGDEEKRIRMDVFLVKKWSGSIESDSEVEEIMWVNSSLPDGLELGSIFKHDVLPKLKELNLID